MLCFNLICITTETKPNQVKRQFNFKKKNVFSRIDTLRKKSSKKTFLKIF